MKRYLLLAIVFISMSSCKKLLEKTPPDSLTPEQAFTNDQDLQLYVNSFYQMLPMASDVYGQSSVNIQGYYFLGDNMSDITVWTQLNPYLAGGFTSTDAQDWTWTDLRNVNYFLAHYQEADISMDRKNYYEGMARFFRAWFYFSKVKMFGDVPWYGQVLSTTDSALYNVRDPRALVMDSVLADINFAVDNIGATKDNTCSTITKWVALGLKSRICLFEGTFRKYHTELGLTSTADTWLQDAADAAGEIMQSGQYAIYSTNKPDRDYRALFTNENPVNTEVLLAAIANTNLKKWDDATGFFSNYGKYQTSLLKRFVNTYLNIDGSRFTDNAGYDSIQFQREVSGRDERLSQTIRTPAYRRSDGSPAPPYLASALSGYQILKFSLDDPVYDLNGQGYNSLPTMRYAEILLNYAEARAELGTFTNADWNETIAVLRSRAGITNTAMPTTLDPYMQDNFYADVSSVAIMEIRRERAIELASEGFRYDDLKRWKEGPLLEKEKDGIYVPQEDQLLDLDQDGKPDVSFVASAPANPVNGVYYFVIDNVNNKLSAGTKGKLLLQTNIASTYPDYKYYAPLPFTELVTNKNLVQNPGWDHP